MGWRKGIYYSTFKGLNLGKSRAERHMDELIDRIKRPIRHRYVIAVMSGGSAGKTTITAALGQTFKIHRTAPAVAIDAAPGFGPLAERIAANPPGDVVALLKETDVQGYSDVRQYLGANRETGLEVLAGQRTSAPGRTMGTASFDAVMDLLGRSGHEVVLVDCGDDPEHPIMKGVLAAANMLVLVSGLTPDAAVPVTRTIEWLKAAGYHQLVSRAMVILNDYRGGASSEARRLLRERFEKIAAVEDLEFDSFLAKGGIIDVKNELDKATRLRLHEIAARLADFYIHDADRVQTRWER
jgi:MinD-like ATPase involved in chromosome partitioning or flagellar assembly